MIKQCALLSVCSVSLLCEFALWLFSVCKVLVLRHMYQDRCLKPLPSWRIELDVRRMWEEARHHSLTYTLRSYTPTWDGVTYQGSMTLYHNAERLFLSAILGSSSYTPREYLPWLIHTWRGECHRRAHHFFVFVFVFVFFSLLYFCLILDGPWQQRVMSEDFK